MSMSKFDMWTTLERAAKAWPKHTEEFVAAYEAYYAKRHSPPGPLRSTEPRIGWRVWKLAHARNATGRVLASVAYSQHAWPKRKPMKRDEIDNRGIHAMKDPQHLKALVRDYYAEVAGSVWMWGEVKEHTKGYLAEFAYPRSLFMAENTDPLVVLELEEAYGVPITLRDLGWQQAPASRSATFQAGILAQMQQLAALQGLLSGAQQAPLQAPPPQPQWRWGALQPAQFIVTTPSSTFTGGIYGT